MLAGVEAAAFRAEAAGPVEQGGAAVYRQTTWIRRGRLVYRYRGQVP